MSTKARAIITNGKGEFFRDEPTRGDPQRGEVLGEIQASGVCHTDFDSMSWKRAMVMGHEGAGIVRQCGPGVGRVNPGDCVLLN